MPETGEIAKQYIVLPQKGWWDEPSSDQVLRSFIDTSASEWRLIIYEEEATDQEILRSAEMSGHFEFLQGPEEDIYGLDDGEPV